MNQELELPEVMEWDIYEEMHRLIELNPWAWQSIGAVLGLVGGALSPAFGTLLIAVTWFFDSEGVSPILNGLTIASFVLTIPLLTFGAHCLDLLERRTARLSLIPEQKYEAPVSAAGNSRETVPGYASIGIKFN